MMEQEQFKKYIYEYLKLISLYLNKKEVSKKLIKNGENKTKNVNN